jgi:hypothetical protein
LKDLAAVVGLKMTTQNPPTTREIDAKHASPERSNAEDTEEISHEKAATSGASGYP